MADQLELDMWVRWVCPECSFVTGDQERAAAHPGKCRRWLEPPELFEVPSFRREITVQTDLL